MSEDCMFCAAKQPVGHVVVWDEEGVKIGRVCSHHTLAELIQDTRDQFMVEVTFLEPEVNRGEIDYGR